MRIEFERISNVRDLGGLPAAGGARVREGLLFRADQPHFASPADLERLAGLGLGLLIDLRNGQEVAEKPDPALPGARFLHLPVFEGGAAGVTRSAGDDLRIASLLERGEAFTADQVTEYMRSLYCRFVRDEGCVAAFAQLVREVLACVEGGRAAMWHCTAGKDRTGFAAAVLLSALGVPRQEIMEDYLLTNACLEGQVEQLLGWIESKLPAGTPTEAALGYFTVEPGFLQAAYDAAEEDWGSFDAFLEGALGVGPDVRERLQAALLVSSD